LFVYLNSMVVVGDEPVIIDTGTPANRDRWLEDVFGLVEPEDVRWVFLSHDDVDHSGNVADVLAACPNAELVCNWAMVERHTNCFNFPLDRCRWIRHDESFSVGGPHPSRGAPARVRLADHERAVRSDDGRLLGGRHLRHAAARSAARDRRPRSGVLAVRDDAVRVRCGDPVVSMLDHDKYGRVVDAVQGLDITTIAACHTPVLEGRFIRRAFERIRELPNVEPPPLPDQSILDDIIVATALPHTCPRPIRAWWRALRMRGRKMVGQPSPTRAVPQTATNAWRRS
jgi:glyoxylase-like metal-dependent hydrolase (beta-lactamase superfamily II)